MGKAKVFIVFGEAEITNLLSWLIATLCHSYAGTKMNFSLLFPKNDFTSGLLSKHHHKVLFCNCKVVGLDFFLVKTMI